MVNSTLCEFQYNKHTETTVTSKPRRGMMCTQPTHKGQQSVRHSATLVPASPPICRANAALSLELICQDQTAGVRRLMWCSPLRQAAALPSSGTHPSLAHQWLLLALFKDNRHVAMARWAAHNIGSRVHGARPSPVDGYVPSALNALHPVLGVMLTGV